MHAKLVVALGISAALVVAGVLLEGTDQNPWNLFMAYFLAVAILQALVYIGLVGAVLSSVLASVLPRQPGPRSGA